MNVLASVALLSAGVAGQAPSGKIGGLGINTGDVVGMFNIDLDFSSQRIGYDPGLSGTFRQDGTGCDWTPNGVSRLYDINGRTISPGLRGPDPSSNNNCFIYQEQVNAPQSNFTDNHFSLNLQRDGTYWYQWIFSQSGDRYQGYVTSEGNVRPGGSLPKPTCSDTSNFRDENGYRCGDWAGYNCETSDSLSRSGRLDVLGECTSSCGTQYDNPTFRDENGFSCEAWVGYDCSRNHSLPLSSIGRQELNVRCPVTCGKC